MVMKKRDYIPTLDGWRALAIGIVCAAHTVSALFNAESLSTRQLAFFVSQTGGVGVDLFFALSGSLIGTLLLEEKRRLGGRIDLGRFYTRRAFRILPPIVAYLAAILALHAVGQLARFDRSEVIATLGFYRNYTSGSHYTQHFWSLAVEEHFYLVIPLVFAIMKWRQALAISACLSLASVVGRWIDLHLEIVLPGMPANFVLYRTENRFDGLMNGAILALLLHRPEIRAVVARVLNTRTAVAVLVATLIGLVTVTDLAIRHTFLAWSFPLLIASTVLHPETSAGRFLELPGLRWVGRLSFSLYIWQQLFLINKNGPTAATPLGWFALLAVPGLASVGFAVVSYYLIERPMFRLGHRLAASPAGPIKTGSHHPAGLAKAPALENSTTR
jgi:peptidoglycan/LPS O-acetylase OafA/YrhL